jgi:peptidoglycan/LPS O-acetylase OafA/YrhL
MLRIWPLYFLVIVIGWSLGLRWPSARIDHHMLLALSLMWANIRVAHVGWQHLASIAPIWSISVEEQFYVAVPLIVRLGGRRALWVVCTATFMASYVALWLLARQQLPPMGPIWTNSFVEFQFFAAGGIIALVCERRNLRISAEFRFALFISGLGLLYAATRCGVAGWEPATVAHTIAGYICALSGVSAIFLSVLGLKKSPPRASVYLGKISYGMYMFHCPLIWLSLTLFDIQFSSVTFQIGFSMGLLAITICIAAISYRFIESPILKYKRRFETVKTRPV